MSGEALDDAALADLAICTSLDVPVEKFVDAAVAAIEENPDNAPMRGGGTGRGHDPGGPLELALTAEKRWKPGRTLRVRFLDGDPAIQAKVREFASQWEQHANITLDFVDAGDAEIRITFLLNGSWSYLGTDNLVIEPDEPTMNFGWLDDESTDDEYSRVVIHEFGHALGCIHEHQNPVAGIPWDEAKVYRYYEATQGWDRDKTFHNVLRRHDTSKTNYTEFDPTSIMQYAVPNGLTEGDFEIGWNSVLSPVDIEFIGVMYPPAGPASRELPAGQRLDAEIGAPGEEDHYHFSIAAEADVTLETGGRTDVVMALYGPTDRTRLVASDDDSGRGYNARIERQLAPGDYFVRIRQYSEQRSGEYTLTRTEQPAGG